MKYSEIKSRDLYLEYLRNKGHKPDYCEGDDPYMKIMLIIGSYAFLWTSAKNQCLLVKIIGIIILTIGFFSVWFGDRKRTKPVLDEIRDNMREPKAGVGSGMNK